MKIRNGFVSNSSSSSFIIGVAAVADLETCQKYIRDNNIKTYGYDAPKLITWGEIKENQPIDLDSVADGKITIESFNYGTVSIDTDKLKDDDWVIYYLFFGDEGDYCFTEDDENDWGDYNYDIDYDFFEKSEQAVMDMFYNPEAAGLNKDECEISFGAGRNG